MPPCYFTYDALLSIPFFGSMLYFQSLYVFYEYGQQVLWSSSLFLYLPPLSLSPPQHPNKNQSNFFDCDETQCTRVPQIWDCQRKRQVVQVQVFDIKDRCLSRGELSHILKRGPMEIATWYKLQVKKGQRVHCSDKRAETPPHHLRKRPELVKDSFRTVWWWGQWPPHEHDRYLRGYPFLSLNVVALSATLTPQQQRWHFGKTRTLT